MQYDDEETSTPSAYSSIKNDVEESTMFGPQRFSSRLRKYKNQSQQSKDTDTSSDTSDDEDENEEEGVMEGPEMIAMQDPVSRSSSSSGPPSSSSRKSRNRFSPLSLLPSPSDVKRKLHDMAHSFFWRHLILWIVMALIASGILAAILKGKNFKFIDCLYLVTSSITGCGLTPVDFSTIPIEGTVWLYLVCLIGGTVAESTIPLMIRFVENSRVQRPSKEAVVRERKAVRRLLIITLVYYVGVQVFCWIPIAFWFQYSEAGHKVMIESQTSAWWVSLFEVGMAFQNAGFVMLKSGSLIPIQTQIVPLIFLAICTTCGNIFFPIYLRLAVMLHLKFSQWVGNEDQVSVLKLILESPRQVSTHLFPKKDTFVYLGVTIIVLIMETFLLMATDFNNKLAFGNLSGGWIFFNCFFQAVTTRTAGFNTINISGISSAGLILILVHMYLAHYPFVIVMRSSNEDVKKRYEKKSDFQIRKLMMWDIMCVILPWYLISAIEQYHQGQFNFNTLFEVISGYGTVGLSVSYSNASFSAQWSVPSKLVIIFVMLMGRHREMPDTIDAAFHDEFDDD